MKHIREVFLLLVVLMSVNSALAIETDRFDGHLGFYIKVDSGTLGMLDQLDLVLFEGEKVEWTEAKFKDARESFSFVWRQLEENAKYLENLKELEQSDLRVQNETQAMFKRKLPNEKERILVLESKYEVLLQEENFSKGLRSELFLKSAALNYFLSKITDSEAEDRAMINSYQYLKKAVVLFSTNFNAVSEYANVLKKISSHAGHQRKLQIVNFNDDLRIAVNAIELLMRNGVEDRTLEKRRKYFIKLLEE